jgi:hypothetical protein
MISNEVAYPGSRSDQLACRTLLNEIEILGHTFHRYRVALNMIKVGVNQGNQAREVIWSRIIINVR